MSIDSKLKIDLDILTLDIDKTGIVNFYQPIDTKALSDVFFAKCAHYKSRLVNQFKHDSRTYRLMKILFVPIFFELTRYSYLCHYADCIQRSEIEVSVPDRYATLKRLLNGEPIDTKLLGKFNNKSNDWVALLKYLPKAIRNAYLNKSSLIKRTINPDIESYDSVSLLFSSLVSDYLTGKNERCYYVDLSHWFDEVLHERVMQQLKPLDKEMDIFISDFVVDMFEGVDPTFDSVKMNLVSSYKQLSKVISSYMDAISAVDQSQIPKKLYVGSSGSLTVRLLSDLVRVNGGEVFKFDHGAGRAFGGDPRSQWQFEFDAADAFVTFSERAAYDYQSKFDENFLFSDLKVSKILGIHRDKQSHLHQKARLSKPIKKIMYLGQVFSGENFQIAKNNPITEMQYLDWAIRLLSQLTSWGYDVFFKVHPAESICIEPPRHIEEVTGCKIITNRYEEVYHTCDLVMFDSLCSSTLPTTASKVERFMFLNMKTVQLSKAAEELLSKDGPLIDTYCDQQCRIQVEWDRLCMTLKNCKLNELNFYNYYYGVKI